MFGGDGLSMLLRNMIGEQQLADIFGTFAKIRDGVVQMGNAVNAIGAEQVAAKDLAEKRHAEVLALFKSLGVEPKPDGSTVETRQITN